MPSSGVVLDTNAWLDMLHFGDARIHSLHQAALVGEVSLFTDTNTLDEFRRVLRYPALGLDGADFARITYQFDALAIVIPDGPVPSGLPKCRDGDDQKFIELAARAEASWLLTRDAELLRMAPRLRGLLGLRVCPPSQWMPTTR